MAQPFGNLTSHTPSYHGPITSMTGAGLPFTSLTNGPPAYARSPSLTGVAGESTTGRSVGQVTSASDAISNPRQTVATQYMLDLTKMKAGDVGNMELTWAELPTGAQTYGLMASLQPMAFKSLTAMNWYLRSREGVEQFGKYLDTRWFNERFSFAGVLRHDVQETALNEPGATTACQTFCTGYRTRVIDVWQSFENKSRPIGPSTGDLLHVVLQRFEWQSELERIAGKKTGLYYWKLCPYFTLHNESAPMQFLYNGLTKSIGECYTLGRCAEVYGVPGNVGAARGVARNYVKGTGDSTYVKLLPKLRQLEIDVLMT